MQNYNRAANQGYVGTFLDRETRVGTSFCEQAQKCPGRHRGKVWRSDFGLGANLFQALQQPNPTIREYHLERA